MATVKYLGKSPRMVAGTFMTTGDVREVNDKLAKALQADPNFVVSGLVEVQVAEVPEVAEEAEVPEEPKVEEVLWEPETPSPALPQMKEHNLEKGAKRSRSKKK